VGRALFSAGGVDRAVLIPRTRGLLPDPEHGSVVASATNAWIAEEWLANNEYADRYLGTIRVCPTDPQRAAAEIHRWAEHPGFVQIGLPLRVQVPYGNPFYYPIWEAAVAHNFPVVVHEDGGQGIELPPTMLGFPTSYEEYYATLPYTAGAHLASLIGDGTFERWPGLRVVWADGGFAGVLAAIWRLDKDWRSARVEAPWVSKSPSAYLEKHVRFVLRGLDRTREPTDLAQLFEIFGAGDLVMFGSNFPEWDTWKGIERDAFSEEVVNRVMGVNAERLYDLASRARLGNG
jgi:predicted TIM-barrel fold metal-dependent hydrolase